MGSSKQKASLFDPYRQASVAATPEEIIRQRLLLTMTTRLGYPKHLITVERALGELPHLKGRSDLPNRRSDILCFGKEIHPEYPLYPLIIIECKEGNAGQEAVQQVLGYNHFVEAPYAAVAGENGAFLVHPVRVDFLPTYAELLERACN